MVNSKIESSLLKLKERWKIDENVESILLGKRKAKDIQVEVNGVIFHIPMLDNLYILWKCLWPECHNCCKNQARLPLTILDIVNISNRLNIKKNELVSKECRIAEWEEREPFGPLVMITMPVLKRSESESNIDDGKPIKCRFLDEKGYCKLHPSRPGCCKLYPFTSWITLQNNRSIINATFQFDGNCPGFYATSSIEEMKSILEEYAKIIIEYNNAVSRTTREGYASITIIE